MSEAVEGRDTVVALTEALTIEFVRGQPTSLVRLQGEIDMHARQALLDVLEPLCARRGRTVEVDLAGVTFIDSTGIGVLVTLHRLSDAATGLLVLSHPTPPVQRVLDLTGMDQILHLA